MAMQMTAENACHRAGIEFEILSACETQCSASLRNVKYTSMNNKCGRTSHRMSLPAAEAVSEVEPCYEHLRWPRANDSWSTCLNSNARDVRMLQ
ncbi:hypothetical protein CEXT_156801 [Caerostris extrusa]|uniref:Uncharacterized protein n=1 Tax=Caerostris extrusa TaxID=172846 RepID=A0AAV4PEE9_CAEEX|nr:hypothetical protein CEXT_156801 [Caerostris extrusa]